MGDAFGHPREFIGIWEMQKGTVEYNKTVAEKEGIKNDADKPPLNLISPYFLDEVATILGFGEAKYGKANWKKGIEFSRLVAATKRHLQAVEKGNFIDEESGKSHLAHAACNLMMIFELERTGRTDLNDINWEKSNDR